MADMSMIFRVFGKDVDASATLHKVGKAAEKTGKDVKGFGAQMGAVFGGLSLQGLATKIVDFGKETVDAFSHAATETRTLQRYLGGTAEQASKLRAAANMTGVSVESLSTGLGRMAKFAYAGATQFDVYEKKVQAANAAHKPLHASLGKNAALFQQMGVSLNDANGEMRPANDILMQLADKFKDMPNGISKTAMVMQIFGRGGMQLLPFLNKGSEGLKEFGIEAEKTGNVLSDKDLKATQQVTIAKRKMHEAVEGLQISIGRDLYPWLSKMANFMSQKVLPALHGMYGVLDRNKKIIGPVAAILGGLIGTLMAFVKVMKIVTAVQTAYTALVGLFTVAEDANTVAVEANTASMMTNPFGIVAVAIAALIAAIVLMCTHWTRTKQIFTSVWNHIKNAGKAVFDWLKQAFRVVGDVVLGYFNMWIKGINMIFGLLNKIPHVHAFGYDVGFNLPKIDELSMNGILGSSSTPKGNGFARQQPMNVTVNVAGHVTTEQQLARVVRDHMAQGIRRRGLSPAVLGV